jgi:hypothetical protein
MSTSAENLVALCERARLEGADFPTVWRRVLRPSPLVIGLPTHDIERGKTRIVVALKTGQKIISTLSAYALQ